jgi:hypothetical protein
MAGTLALESVPGVGSTFSFTVTFARYVGAAAQTRERPQATW